MINERMVANGMDMEEFLKVLAKEKGKLKDILFRKTCAFQVVI
jgi:hypothetical protein